MSGNALPLSIRTTPPDQTAERIEPGLRPDGLPDGVHTGGVWRFNGEIWKPLDGRPFTNAENHYPTQEAEFLAAVADLPFFPRNWRVEERNGRQWLVRPEAQIVPPREIMNRSMFLELEQSIREVNSRGWEIGDEIVLAYAENGEGVGQYFVLDCSTAWFRPATDGVYAADDTDRVKRFFKQGGLDWIVQLRENGKAVVSPLEFQHRHKFDIERAGGGDFRHVYASFSRPVSLIWARFEQPVIIEHADRANWDQAIPHSWIVTRDPLSYNEQSKYQLQWAYSPITYKHGGGSGD
ncbi:MAG: hypothetical protein JW892_17530 [Anaerolineae bacterium]|nr:hypothetical protein [Anaerolineae bacterium]